MTRAEAIEAAALNLLATHDEAKLLVIEHPLTPHESRRLKSAKRSARKTLRKALAMPKDVRTEWSEAAQGFVAAHAPEPGPEPVAFVSKLCLYRFKLDSLDALPDGTMLYAHPPAARRVETDGFICLPAAEHEAMCRDAERWRAVQTWTWHGEYCVAASPGVIGGTVCPTGDHLARLADAYIAKQKGTKP